MQAHGASPDRAEEAGRLELFGFSARAGGLVIAGRVPRRVADELASGEFIVHFGSEEVPGSGCAGFYPRGAAGEDSLGAIVFVALAERPRGRPTALTTQAVKHRFAVPAHDAIREFAAEAPPKWLAAALLQRVNPPFPGVLIEALLPDWARPTGIVDAMAYDAALGGWLIAGSVALPDFADGETVLRCSLAGIAQVLPALV
ncbi:MAG TPA: hypothetical protein VJR70_09690, partial [Stellaceae bacterium]|nr:hypothetical protein [Stellaceae bacterium]